MNNSVILLKANLVFFLKLIRISNNILLRFKIPSELKLKRNDLKKIIRKKNGKSELFILGSGKSISEITKKDYEYISKSVSIGVGRWAMNDFVPDILINEVDDLSNEAWIYDSAKIINEKKKQYSEALIIIDLPTKFNVDNIYKVLNLFDSEIRKNIKFCSANKIPSGTDLLFELFCIYIKKMIPLKLFLPFWHCRSSVIGASLFGVYFQTKKCVFFGVDGYSGYHNKLDKKYGRHFSKNNNEELHSTSNPKYGKPTVQTCIYYINKYLFKCEVNTENSILFENIEIWKKD